MKRFLEIQIIHQPPAVILLLSGEIGPLSHTDLLEAGQAAADSGQPLVILDFQAVEYMNSAGISGLIQLLTRLGSRGQVVYACGLSVHDRLIFNIMRLDEAFRLAADPQAAINDYTQKSAGPQLGASDLNPEVANDQPAI